MRGGYRQNAGRKQGFSSKSAEEARRLLSERVMQEIGPIGDALISQAKIGNIAAIKELFDRSWGRAPQAMHMTIEKEEVIEASERIQDLAYKLNELDREGKLVIGG
jgi:hypothetical protein